MPWYLIFSLLAVVFGLMNMALLKPLLDVIFDQKSVEELSEYASKPEFELNVNYFVDAFNHFMYQTVQEHGKFGSLKARSE